MWARIRRGKSDRRWPVAVATRQLIIGFAAVAAVGGSGVLAAGSNGKPARSLELFASPSGVGAKCSASHPCRITVAKAKVRSLLGQMKHHGDARSIEVKLAGGTYQFAETLSFGPEDSGIGQHVVSWIAADPSNPPVLSGAKRISSWRLVDASKRLWAADVPDSLETRQLYIDGERVPVASGRPTMLLTKTERGFTAADSTMAGWRNPSDIEFVFKNGNGRWSQTRCRVASIQGPEIVMQQPCWDYANKREAGVTLPGNLNMTSRAKPTSIENAFEILHPGQWYLDTAKRRLYLMAADGQAPARSDVEAPVLETLLEARGTLDAPARNLRFSGLQFSYATWLGASEPSGYSSIQGGTFVGGYDPAHPDPSRCDPTDPAEPCYYRQIPGNVVLHAAHNVIVEDSTFTHLGATGLAIEFGSRNNVARGNEFTDTSGGGIVLGSVSDPHPADVGADDREISRYNVVHDNFIHHTGVEYPDASGILHLYTQHTSILHNELTDLPWDGIDSGALHGQIDTPVDPDVATNINADNTIAYNLVYDIHKTLNDGGSIYTAGHQGQTIRKPDGAIDTDASLRHGLQLYGNVVYHMNGCCWALYNELGAQWTTWTNNAEWGNLHGHGGGLPVGHIRFTHNYAANGIGFFTNVPPDPIDVILQNNTTIPDRPTGRDVPDQILASAGLTGRYRSLTTDQGPVVQSFEPRSGAATAATQVLITGRGFQPGTTVSWGSTRATSVEVLSSNFVRATAPAGTPLAQLTITTPRGTVTAPEPRPIDEQFDAAAISNDWSPQNGEMENTGGKTYSYSAQELAAAGAAPGAKIVHDGLEFTWASAPIGEPDAVQSRGQAIEVEGNGDTLGFLYAGLSAVSGTGTVLYRDGTQQSYEIDAGAWNDRTPGKEVVLTTTVNEHTYRREDPDEPFPVYVYYASVPLDPSKEVAAVVLPFTAWPNAAPLRSEEGSKIIDVFAIAVGHGEGGG